MFASRACLGKLIVFRNKKWTQNLFSDRSSRCGIRRDKRHRGRAGDGRKKSRSNDRHANKGCCSTRRCRACSRLLNSGRAPSQPRSLSSASDRRACRGRTRRRHTRAPPRTRRQADTPQGGRPRAAGARPPATTGISFVSVRSDEVQSHLPSTRQAQDKDS